MPRRKVSLSDRGVVRVWRATDCRRSLAAERSETNGANRDSLVCIQNARPLRVAPRGWSLWPDHGLVDHLDGCRVRYVVMLRLVVFVLLSTAAVAQTRTPRCEPVAGRRAERVDGRIARGETFSHVTPAGWILRLVPVEEGWFLQVASKDRSNDDLARLTAPWHFTPNPRQIDGCHFRNAENTGPNDGSVNAPQELREFIFSPRVGRDIQGADAKTSPTIEEVEAVRSFGRGWFLIESYRLTPTRRGERASFESLQFSACLTWVA